MPSPKVIPHIDSLKDHVGEPLGTSDWLEVGQERIDAFAEATGDHQWIHVDVERARRESPFGGPIAHGYLTLSLIPLLLPQLIVVEGASRIVNYGIEKMRMPAPVPSGARVRLSGTLQGVRGVPGGGARVTLSLRFEVEGAKKAACQGEVVYVYFP